ncbi:MAG: hypothetical protein JST80_12615 [Bdellovibrionales bacterium]|nr:hypothetical protein [Bdellovibrionales bacterium]
MTTMLLSTWAGMTTADRTQMTSDLEELLQYLPNLQKNLEQKTRTGEQQ